MEKIARLLVVSCLLAAFALPLSGCGPKEGAELEPATSTATQGTAKGRLQSDNSDADKPASSAPGTPSTQTDAP